MPATKTESQKSVLAHTQTWVWAVVAATVAAGVLIFGIHRQQSENVRQVLAAQDVFHRARLDMAKGFLHTTLAGDPSLPFNRDQGLALLRQAVASCKNALQRRKLEDEDADARLIATFQEKVDALQAGMDAWSSQPGRNPQADLQLRRVFSEVEKAAEQMDAELQRDLRNVLERNSKGLNIALGVSSLLFAICCGGVFVAAGEQRKSRTALEESERQFRSMFELASVAFGQANPATGLLVMANDKYCELTGYTRAELLTKTIQELTHPDDRERDALLFQRAARGEISQYLNDKRYVRKDGKSIWVRVNASFMRDEQGKPWRTMAVIEDITEQKNAEEALRDSEQRLRLANEVAGIGIYYVDMATKTTRYSPEMCAIMGIPEGTVLGEKGGLDLVHPEDRGLANARMAQAMNPSGPGSVRMEMRIVRPNGEIRWVNSFGRVTFKPTEKGMMPDHMVGVAYDVTERRQAEEALRVSNERLRLATEAAPMGLWDTDLTTGKLHWSDHLWPLFGLEPDPENLTFEKFRNAIHPDDRERVLAAIAKSRENDVPYSVEFRVVHPDGKIRWASSHGRVIRNTQGHPIRALGVDLDITDRKRTEAALRESEGRFRMLANAMPQLAWIAQTDGHVTWYNQRWYDYTGTTTQQMEGWGWKNVHDPAVLPKVMEQWEASLASGIPFEMEFPLRNAKGEFYPFLARAYPVRDAKGVIVQWFGTNTDITQIKAAEEKIRSVNVELEARVANRTKELEAANKELEAFSYSISHDLRSPLRTMDGYAQALLEDYSNLLPPDGVRYLQTIRGGAQRMGMLIDDLLTFSRLSRLPVNKQPVNMLQLVQETVAEQQELWPGRKIEIKYGMLPVTQGDPALLKQVWVNLLSNAFKYTSKKDQAEIEIGCTGTEVETIYHVRDNGTGFDMKYAGKLFGVFQRLHRSEDFVGTGVGLAIVQRVLQRHGGRVWAEALENVGAAFYFTVEPKRKL